MKLFKRIALIVTTATMGIVSLLGVNAMMKANAADKAVTFNLGSKTGDMPSEASDEKLEWIKDGVTITADKATSTVATNNYYPGTEGKSYSSTRFYKNSTLTISSSSLNIVSVVGTATTTAYASVLSSSTWTNASGTASGTSVTITASSNVKQISCTIGGTTGFTSFVVNLADSTPELKLNKKVLNLEVGSSETLVASVSPSDLSAKTIEWTSDNPLVATVSNTGVVTAISSGNAKITASIPSESLQDSCNVTVNTPVKKAIFDANGGKFIDNSTKKEILANNEGIINQSSIEIPSFDYKVFKGWFKDAAATLVANTAEVLSGPTTYYAGWRNYEDSDIVSIASMQLDNIYRVKGEVTALYGNKSFVLQDNSGGIVVYNVPNGTFKIGNEVTLTGRKQNYVSSNGTINYVQFMTDEQNLNAIVTDTTDTTIDTVPLTNLSDVSENNAGKLVKLDRITLTDSVGVNKSVNLVGNNNFVVRIPGADYVTGEEGAYAAGTELDILGFVMVYQGNLQLQVSDIKKSPEIVKYTIQFESNGGTAVSSQTVAEGGRFTRPADPTKNSDGLFNYSFAGWYTDNETFLNEYMFIEAASNITVYAKWNKTKIPAETSLTSSNTLAKLSYDFVDNSVDKTYLLSSLELEDGHDCNEEILSFENGKFTVKFENLGTQSNPLYKTAESAIYAQCKIKITISSSEQFTSLNIGVGTKYGLILTSNVGSITQETNHSYTWAGAATNSLIITNNQTSNSARIKSFHIINDGGVEFSNLKLYFGATVNKQVIADLKNEGKIIKGFGTCVLPSSKIESDETLKEYLELGLLTNKYNLMTNGDISNDSKYFSNERGYKDEGELNYLSWYIGLNVPNVQVKTKITALAYVLVSENGVDKYICLKEREFSVETIVNAYIEAGYGTTEPSLLALKNMIGGNN